jgi:hypothetical protein
MIDQVQSWLHDVDLITNARGNASKPGDKRDVTHAKTTTATNIKSRIAAYSGSNDSSLSSHPNRL